MEHLRDGIGLRGYGQRDPKQEYKKEGYNIFVGMMATTSSNVISQLFQYKVMRETEVERMEREERARAEAAQQRLQMRHGSEVEGEGDGEEQAAKPSTPPPRKPQVVAPVKREGPKIGRNDLCPCGSGLKFKKCHGEALEGDEPSDGDDATA
jgi:preprotein translocase subunit SecA